MSGKVFIGNGNIAREREKIFIGVNNKAHQWDKAYIGDASGKARLFYQSQLPAVLTPLSAAKRYSSAVTMGSGGVAVLGGLADTTAEAATVNYYAPDGTRSVWPPLTGGSITGGVKFGDGDAIIVYSDASYRYSVSGQRTTMVGSGIPVGNVTVGEFTDGKALAVGGFYREDEDRIWYNYARTVNPNNTMTVLTSLSISCCWTCIVRVGSGTIVAGGQTNSFNSHGVVNYYSSAGQRSVWTAMSIGRQSAAGVRLGDGSAIIAGGATKSAPVTNVDHYSTTGVKTTWTPLSVARAYAYGATLGDGGAMVVGTNDTVDRYTMAGQRTTLSPLSVGRSFMCAASMGDGGALVAGGQILGGISGNVLTDAVDTVYSDR